MADTIPSPQLFDALARLETLAGIEDDRCPVEIPARMEQAVLRMEQRLHLLESELAGRAHELDVLQSVHAAINSQIELPGVLQMIADQARVLTGCHASTVYLLEGENLRLAVVSGCLDSEIGPGYVMPVQGSIAGLALQEQRPYRIIDALQDERVYRDAIVRSNVHSFLIAPLISGDKPVGVISVANKISGVLDAADERILTLLASSAVISLENARLYAQVLDAAAANERTRLARELHDAVTQNLFAASLIGDVLPQIWEINPVEGRRRLEELRRLTRGALAEMRTMLLELRPAALKDAPLSDLFRYLTNAFTGRAQVPADLRIEGNCPLPEEVKLVFYRVAQEALNNIARHAEAENVYVSLHCSPGKVELQVVDDGLGFDPQTVAKTHMGVQNMLERAQSIGAQLEVNSALGEGTQIMLVWLETNGVNHGG